jgi:hypothetical protein
MSRQEDRTGALSRAVDTAIQGKPGDLYALLARGSGLPGVRPNLPLAERFAQACVERGSLADALLVGIATLDPDHAPGATELEFLPMCGVVAAGARGAADAPSVSRMLSTLQTAAEDLRWRVRDAVPSALARIGASRGEGLLEDVAPWMNRFFSAAAVLLASSRNEWLSRIEHSEALLLRLDEAFALARDADRSTERYPGYKALVLALATSPGVIAARFGRPVFDRLVGWSAVKEPMLREAVAKSIEGTRLGRRFGEEVARVKKALEETAPVPRDPRAYVGPTRRRGRRSR